LEFKAGSGPLTILTKC